MGLLVALLLASCGVRTESNADVVDDDRVPFGLLDADRQPVTGPSSNGAVLVDVYLSVEEGDALSTVTRRVGSSSLDAVLAELERSPTDAESADGLRSALTDVEAIAGTEVSRGVATVDLSDSFAEISGSEQLVAIAQLVYTATARPGIGQVTFTLEGQPIEVPRGDGSLTGDAVTRGDYARMAPEGA
jgi:spore germination protein GerM